jgi:hypothetical protein
MVYVAPVWVLLAYLAMSVPKELDRAFGSAYNFTEKTLMIFCLWRIKILTKTGG